MITIDSIDHKILAILQKDAKLTTKEIAAELGLTTTPTHERIKRLERLGYIKKYVALVDRKRINLSLLAFCNVSLRDQSKRRLIKFEQEIAAFEEVLECYHITGIFDYMLKVVVANMDDYHNFAFHKMGRLDNIENIQTIFAMNDIKHTTAFPV